MFRHMTNIDELEIHDMKKASFDMGEKDQKYDKVEWIALDDKNAQNYSQFIKFDTTDVKSELPIYRESYAVFPVSAKSSGAAYTAKTRLAFKASVLSLIRTASIKPTGGNAPTLVNEIDGQLPLINNIRLLTQSDIDWIECSGSELHFFGCDRRASRNVMGDGQVCTSAITRVSSGLPSTDAHTNMRLAERVSVFSSTTDNSDVTKFKMLISIPLKFLHPFFDQLSFPLPNYPMKIEFGLSSITNGQVGFMPIVCPTASVTGKFDIEGKPAVQAEVVAAPAPTLSIDTSISINGYAPGACRLYLKCVTLRGKDADEMEAQLTRGYKKTISYLTTDIHEDLNITTSAVGQKYHREFGTNTKRPVRVWALFPPKDSRGSSTSLFPGTVGPCTLDQCNIKIGGKEIRKNSWENQFELYNELRQYQLGSGYRTQQGAPISYADFCNGARFYLFDVSRHEKVVNNMPVTFVIDGFLRDASSGPVDALFLVERLQTVFLDINRNKATTSWTDGVEKD